MSPVFCISLLRSTQRRMNSSGLSGSADSVGDGSVLSVVGAGVKLEDGARIGSGSSSLQDINRSSGTARAASERSTTRKAFQEPMSAFRLTRNRRPATAPTQSLWTTPKSACNRVDGPPTFRDPDLAAALGIRSM